MDQKRSVARGDGGSLHPNLSDLVGTAISLVSLVPQLQLVLGISEKLLPVGVRTQDRARIEESVFHAELTITRYPSRGLALLLI